MRMWPRQAREKPLPRPPAHQYTCMSSGHSHHRTPYPGAQFSSTPPTTGSHTSRFPPTARSRTLAYTKAIVPAPRRPKSTKVYRCNCTRMCKDPNGVIVSERTWYRHAEHRGNDEFRRRDELRALVEPANRTETRSPECIFPGSESNKRRRLEDVCFPSSLVDALTCF